MSRFMDDYEPVEERLKRFWKDHDQGRVLTELVRAEGDLVIFRAEAYRDSEDTRPASTGYAHEITGSSPVNKTSALENCETSAIGRALANMGYAPKGQRPSREEMSKVSRSARPALAAEAPEGGASTGKAASPPVASVPDADEDQEVSRLRRKWRAIAKGKKKTEQTEGAAICDRWSKKSLDDLDAGEWEAEIELFMNATVVEPTGTDA